MWQVFKASGRPWPSLSDDDVVDYMIMEAVALRVNQEEAEAQKLAERKPEQRSRAKELAKQFA